MWIEHEKDRIRWENGSRSSRARLCNREGNSSWDLVSPRPPVRRRGNPMKYQLTETESYNYLERTERNVREGDGTIILPLEEKLEGIQEDC